MIRGLCFFLIIFLSHNLQARRILHFGDSQVVGPFGLATHCALQQQHRICSFGDWGAAAYDYISSFRQLNGYYRQCGDQRPIVHYPSSRTRPHTPNSIERMISLSHPDLAIIQLGGNFYDSSDRAEQIRTMIAMATANGEDCIWIGPPNNVHRNQELFNSFYDLLYQITASEAYQCEVYDSRWVIPPRGVADEVHLNYISHETLENRKYNLPPLCSDPVARQGSGGRFEFQRNRCRTGQMRSVEWSLDFLYWAQQNFDNLEFDTSCLRRLHNSSRASVSYAHPWSYDLVETNIRLYRGVENLIGNENSRGQTFRCVE